MKGLGWRWFAVWAAPGVLLGLGLSALGVLTVPLFVVLAAALVATGRGGAESFGALCGAGLVPAGVAAFNPAYSRLHWGLAAGVLLAGGLGGYLFARRRRSLPAQVSTMQP